MLHRALTSSVTMASLTIVLASAASANIQGATPSQSGHTWVGAGAGAAAVLSVHPGYWFSASERPSFDAGGVKQDASAAGSARTLIAQSPTAGAITLVARHIDGAEAVDVTGTAPPGAGVEITALAKISIDLPVVFLNRFDTVADASGTFSVRVPIAPDYVPGSEILIQAQAAGATSVMVSYFVGAPTSGPPITSTDVDNDRCCP
jgi:hypothetical protein